LTGWPATCQHFLDGMNLKMKVLRSFETSINIYQWTRRNTPEGLNFH
jgi:hypothetical protein